MRSRRTYVERLESRRLLATFTVTHVGDAGSGSLRQAILDANANLDPDEITFALGPGSHRIEVVEGLPPISTPIDIQGPGADRLDVRLVDPVDDNSVFQVNPGGDVAISDLTVSRATTPIGVTTWGVNNMGTLHMTRCRVGGGADYFFSGILSGYGSLILDDCTISGNAYGMIVGNATLNNTRISDNLGAGLAVWHGTATLNDCLITRNGDVNGSSGGGILANASTLTLNDCTITANQAQYGAGVAVDGFLGPASVTLVNCNISGNRAFSTDGGGVHLYAGGSASLINCTLVGNTAGGFGGAVAAVNVNSAVSLTNCTVVSNRSNEPGGGIALRDGAQCRVNNSILRGNSAPADPQISPGGTVLVTHSNIEGGWAGPGNIAADPVFTSDPSPGADETWGTPDDEYGDLRLQSSSPCIDSGSNSAVSPTLTTDLAAKPRFADVPGHNDPGVIVDMGAYEHSVALAGVDGDFLFDAPRPTVRVSFNANLLPASLAAGDLTLQNLTTGQTIDTGALALAHYDATGFAAEWSFPSLLPDGDYRATLPAGSVSDAGGDPLGSPFTFDFFVLAGDANRDRTVNLADFNILAANFGQSDRTFRQGDFNYDGTVNLADFNILAARFGQVLAAPVTVLRFGSTQIKDEEVDQALLKTVA